MLKTSRGLVKSSVWSRGVGFLGSLGSGDWAARENFEKIEELSGIEVSAGWAHSAVITPESRQVLVWGRTLDPASTLLRVNRLHAVWPPCARLVNSLSLLFDTGGQFTLLPKLLPIDSRAKNVHCGAGITLVLGEDGSLWSYGCNEYGQAGIGKTSTCVYKPQRLPLYNGIVQAALGLRHGLALDAKGQVYSWGKNQNGQLGNGNIEETTAPDKSLDLPQIKAVAAGFSHSAALSEQGEVFVWGKMRSNRSFQTQKSILSAHLPQVRSDATRPRQLQFPPGTPPITHLACSALHTVVMDAQGDIWAMGLEKHTRDMISEPRRLVTPMTLPTSTRPSWCLRSGILTTALFLEDVPNSPIFHPVLEGGACVAEQLMDSPQGHRLTDITLGWKHQHALTVDEGRQKLKGQEQQHEKQNILRIIIAKED